MAELIDDTKQVVVYVSERLWLRAKSTAALRDIPLKDFVAIAIQNELDNKTNNS